MLLDLRLILPIIRDLSFNVYKFYRFDQKKNFNWYYTFKNKAKLSKASIRKLKLFKMTKNKYFNNN